MSAEKLHQAVSKLVGGPQNGKLAVRGTEGQLLFFSDPKGACTHFYQYLFRPDCEPVWLYMGAKSWKGDLS